MFLKYFNYKAPDISLNLEDLYSFSILHVELNIHSCLAWIFSSLLNAHQSMANFIVVSE